MAARGRRRRIIDSVTATGAKFLKIFPTTFGRDNITPDIYFTVLAQAADSGQHTFEHLLWVYLTSSAPGDL